MQQAYSLSANTRTKLGKMTAEVRAEGMIPGIIYGHNTENIPVSVPAVAFEKVYREAGESSLVDISLDGKASLKVLIHDIQRDALSYRVSHVDFFKVNMTEKLTATIQLEFVGEAPAVEQLGGTLVKSIDEIEVRCLPSDLVSEIEVDISSLATFEDHITIAAITLPKGMELLHHEAEDVVASVAEPISEAELAALDSAVDADVSAVEVEKKGKEEEGAE